MLVQPPKGKGSCEKQGIEHGGRIIAGKGERLSRVDKRVRTGYLSPVVNGRAIRSSVEDYSVFLRIIFLSSLGFLVSCTVEAFLCLFVGTFLKCFCALF